MAKKKSAAKEAAPAYDETATVDEIVAAQQASMDAGEGSGYVGTMSPEEKAAEEARMEAILNVPDDYKQGGGFAPIFLSRDPDAVANDENEDEVEEGAALGQANSRVGFLTVEHPRSRMAATLHDHLRGDSPATYSVDELSALAEKVGMNVDGSGVNGAVLKTDFVRAMDTLTGQYPAAPTS